MKRKKSKKKIMEYTHNIDTNETNQRKQCHTHVRTCKGVKMNNEQHVATHFITIKYLS